MSEETRQEVWERACRYTLAIVRESLFKVGHDTAAEDLLKFPLPPYFPVMPKELLDG